MTEIPLHWVGRTPTTTPPEDRLQLLGLSPTSHLRALKPPVWTPTLAALATQIAADLVAAHTAAALSPAADFPPPIPLDSLSPEEHALLVGFLGEGEVTAHCLQSHHRAVESLLPGVWRVATPQESWLEVGEIPHFVRQSARRLATPPVLPPPPPGLMNAPSLLAEIYAKAQAHRWGEANAVMTLSLFPLNEADAAYLPVALGEIGLELQSRGFGHCRLVATATPRCWAVQYLNAMGIVILDTLEIGDVPTAAVAAAEDFADSATRLQEIIEAYA